VHILFALSRAIPICDVIEDVKKSSSRWIKTKDSAFRNFQWQTGYGAFSVGQFQISRVQEYIANQNQHHRRRSFQDEFRKILRKYRVEFDEQYVWD